mmetsp:Transcript_29133/g.37563  ORF Transcript_29133/g.37563 Transcript_29133/m.37563 type:complete len:85 (-) Transcript_29133:232-486(-)
MCCVDTLMFSSFVPIRSNLLITQLAFHIFALSAFDAKCTNLCFFNILAEIIPTQKKSDYDNKKNVFATLGNQSHQILKIRMNRS